MNSETAKDQGSASSHCYTVQDNQGRGSEPDPMSVKLEVVGAGYLTFNTSMVSRCGNATGISVDCGWSKYGYSGGVMDRDEVIRLRDCLNEWLGENGRTVDAIKASV